MCFGTRLDRREPGERIDWVTASLLGFVAVVVTAVEQVVDRPLAAARDRGVDLARRVADLAAPYCDPAAFALSGGIEAGAAVEKQGFEVRAGDVASSPTVGVDWSDVPITQPAIPAAREAERRCLRFMQLRR